MMTQPLIVVVGLKREAALVSGAGVIAIVGGGDGAGLMRKLEAALERAPAAAGVVSVGIGGALSPELHVGDWVVADRVVADRRAWPTFAPFRDMLRSEVGRLAPRETPDARNPRHDEANAGAQARLFGRVFTGVIAGSDVMVVDAAAKAALHAATGALAVDMESHLAARFAAEHGLHFAALRVISDGADRALPKAAQSGMKKDGGMDILAVLVALARNPHQLLALIRTGREAEVAFQQLKLLNRHDLLGRLGVGDPDLGELPLDVV